MSRTVPARTGCRNAVLVAAIRGRSAVGVAADEKRTGNMKVAGAPLVPITAREVKLAAEETALDKSCCDCVGSISCVNNLKCLSKLSKDTLFSAVDDAAPFVFSSSRVKSIISEDCWLPEQWKW